FRQICQAHSRVIPLESYSNETSVDARLRSIVALQQKAARLEAEISLRKRCEADLRKREEDLQDFLENATEGIHQAAILIVTDVDRREKGMEGVDSGKGARKKTILQGWNRSEQCVAPRADGVSASGGAGLSFL